MPPVCLTDWRLLTGPPGVHNFIEFHPLGSWHAIALGVCLARLSELLPASAASTVSPSPSTVHAALLRGHRLLRRFGVSLSLLVILVFFSAADPP
eukprot:7160483-Pyramimonas_sp.AAC.1